MRRRMLPAYPFLRCLLGLLALTGLLLVCACKPSADGEKTEDTGLSPAILTTEADTTAEATESPDIPAETTEEATTEPTEAETTTEEENPSDRFSYGTVTDGCWRNNFLKLSVTLPGWRFLDPSRLMIESAIVGNPSPEEIWDSLGEGKYIFVMHALKDDIHGDNVYVTVWKLTGIARYLTEDEYYEAIRFDDMKKDYEARYEGLQFDKCMVVVGRRMHPGYRIAMKTGEAIEEVTGIIIKRDDYLINIHVMTHDPDTTDSLIKSIEDLEAPPEDQNIQGRLN